MSLIEWLSEWMRVWTWGNVWPILGPVIGGVIVMVIQRIATLKPLVKVTCKRVTYREGVQVVLIIEGKRKEVRGLFIKIIAQENDLFSSTYLKGDYTGTAISGVGRGIKSQEVSFSARNIYSGQKIEWYLNMEGSGPKNIRKPEIRTDAKYELVWPPLEEPVE